ncbi:putative Gnk2-like domain-containing protein [Helianthus anomalus]
MFITSGSQLFLWIFLCFIYITNTVTLAQPDFIFYFCANKDNYTINSTFERNLDTTFSTLPTTNSGLGFFNHSTPEGNDMVHSQGRNQRGVKRDLSSLMNKLKADAVAGDSLLKFAAGNTTGPDFVTIYGLVQCTPDLSEMQCTDCLENAYSYYAMVFNRSGKIGGTVFQPMCRYSYGLSRFFNEGISSPRVSSSSPALPPVSSSPSLPGTKCNSVYLILSIYTTRL